MTCALIGRMTVATGFRDPHATSWPDSTIIALVSICHQRNYVEPYSRYNTADDSVGAGGLEIADAAYNWQYKCSYTASLA